MKAIKLNNLTDVQFQKYMKLLESIKNKYEENSFVLDYDWNEYRGYYFKDYSDWDEFKIGRLAILKAGEKFSLNEFIIFDDEKPLAFIAFKRVSELIHEFIFDSEYVETPEEVLKIIFEVLNFFLTESDVESVYYLANKNSEKELFKKAGIEIVREIVNSKLLKKDIDFEKLRVIVDNNENVKDYNLILYREIPEEIYDRYIDFMNEVWIAKEFYNPVKQEFKKYTKEDLLRSIRIDKEDGDPMYMFTLFDKEKIVGYCKVYIEKEDNSVFIQQCAGITAVAVKYRGKGFGKYLKALMYLKILQDYPNFRHILTDTYPWNKYMFRINEEFGFKIFCEGCIFRFTKEHLEKISK